MLSRITHNPPPPEVRFRWGVELLGLWLAGDEPALSAKLSERRESPQEFLEFLDRQKLRLQFAAGIEESKLRDLFDPEALAERDRALLLRRNRQRRLVEELGWIDDLFTSLGVEFRLFKGPSLAVRFFGGVENRIFGDLDLLIPRERLGEVHRALVAAGAERRSSAMLGENLATRFAHGWDYARGDLRLDLHWAPATHVSYRIDIPRLWREEDTLEIRGRRIPILSDESALLFLALSLFEDLDRGGGRLKSVVDLDAMLRVMDTETDWRAFFARAASERLEGIVRTILRMVVDLAGGAERCPALVRELTGQRVYAPGTRVRQCVLFEAARGRPGNKLWAAELYACGRTAALVWWAISLPFRIAAYNPSFRRRLQLPGQIWRRFVG